MKNGPAADTILQLQGQLYVKELQGEADNERRVNISYINEFIALIHFV